MSNNDNRYICKPHCEVYMNTKCHRTIKNISKSVNSFIFYFSFQLTDKIAGNRYFVGLHPNFYIEWKLFLYALAVFQSHKVSIYGFIIESNKMYTDKHHGNNNDQKNNNHNHQLMLTLCGRFGCEFVLWNWNGANRKNCIGRNDISLSGLSAIQLNSIQINLYYLVPIICFLFLFFFSIFHILLLKLQLNNAAITNKSKHLNCNFLANFFTGSNFNLCLYF